jgi:cyclopropane-fatty-acyl-phospholipid synthase
MDRFQARIQEILDLVDVRLDGDRPWDMRVHEADFFKRVLAQGTIGLGESYMDGWWDCDSLDQLADRVLGAEVEAHVQPDLSLVLTEIEAKLWNLQTRRRAKVVARQHYDLGNEFFAWMLDSRMQYTCAYWKEAASLEAAQEAKLRLICDKIALVPGERVLDLGCGWGGFARFAAERYGCRVTAVNISKEQIAFAREHCAGLPVELLAIDYRDVSGTFDKVVAIGLCEHVGPKNYRRLMETVHRGLRDGGLFLLHTIGSNRSERVTDPWIDRYIFPHSLLPSITRLGKAAEGLFVVEDWHNFGSDYDRTLMAWYAKLLPHRGAIVERFGERFLRMWDFYLLVCAGSFRCRRNQLWQVVLSKGGVRGGYTSVR